LFQLQDSLDEAKAQLANTLTQIDKIDESIAQIGEKMGGLRGQSAKVTLLVLVMRLCCVVSVGACQGLCFTSRDLFGK